MKLFFKTQDPEPRTQCRSRAPVWPAPLPSPLLHSYLRPLSGRKNAFTLIEMLIVISIISVLLGLLYGALERAQKFSRRTITYTELKSIETALKQYHAHYHAWPSNTIAPFVSGEDSGFVITEQLAKLLQGNIPEDGGISESDLNFFNPERLPFIEFSRYSPVYRAPVNPFKPNSAIPNLRMYFVLFDTNGDRTITVPCNDSDGGTLTQMSTTNIIASVAVWTFIPATRKTDSSGNPQNASDVIFGSWESFSVK